MYQINEIDLSILKEIEKDNCYKQTVFTTDEWITFLKNNKKGEPVILSISQNNDIKAIFIGMTFKRFGVKILGSPFEGWATCNMGFCINTDNDCVDFIECIKEYVFKKLGCWYMEIVDPKITYDKLTCLNYKVVSQGTYLLNINQTDELLFKGFKTDCRNFIRQFERRGAIIMQVNPSIEFANEYYNQLIDVFEKQNLNPNYDKKKVHDLMEAFSINHENMLCLKVCNPEGECIATSIFIGLKETCYFWGGASYRKYQHYRPNEYMIWYAIKYWREKGLKYLDMVGIRDYKKKFGPEEVEYPRIIFSKYKILLTARNIAKNIIIMARKLKGKKYNKGMSWRKKNEFI